MAPFGTFLIVFYTAAILAVFSASGLAAGPENGLDPTEFRTEFDSSFLTGDTARMAGLAVNRPDLLRPLLEQLLSDSLPASRSNDAGAKKHALNFAASVAGQLKMQTGDKWPAQQVKRYSSWSSKEIEDKLGADGFLGSAENAFEAGRYSDVLTPGMSALDLYARLGDWAGEGDALHILGQARRKLADYSSALLLHERAIALARNNGDGFRQGRGLIDLADVYERRKNRPRAVKLYSEALRILKVPAEWREAGRALRQLGDVYVATGEFKRAYEVYSCALSYAEAANDPVLIAEYNDYLGYCHRKVGDYENAVKHHRKAVSTAEKIEAPAAAARARARAFNHLGICLQALAEQTISEGELVKGREFYADAAGSEEEALRLSKETEDRWREGYILRALSTIHRQLGMTLAADEAAAEYRNALDYADQALELALTMKEQEWEGLALHEKGLALSALGRQAEGLTAFQRALELWEGIGDLLSAGYAHRFIARQFKEPGGQLDEAARAYGQSRTAFQKIGDAEMEACAMTDMARVYGELDQKKKAEMLYDGAIVKLEGVRSRAGFLDFRKSLMGKVYDRYEEAALFMLENGLDERAFKLAESMKARLFLDQLAEARVDLSKGIDPGLKRRRDQLEKELSDMTNSIADAYRNKAPDDAAISKLRERQELLAGELDALKKQIRLKNRAYASVQYPEPVSLRELQKKVLKNDEALIEYLVSKGGVYCFVVTRERFQVAKLPVDEGSLKRVLERLLKSLAHRKQDIRGSEPGAASEVYDLLLKPFEWAMKGRTLFIVPDGILARLPFEALVVTDAAGSHYFIEQQTVKYLQSASVLATLRAGGPGGGKSLLFMGFGDPVYDFDHFKAGQPELGENLDRGDKTAITRYSRVGGQLSRLKGSGEEVSAIGHIFADANRSDKAEKVLLRADATKENAMSPETAKFGYIHFSAHGILAPGFQAIALSQIPGGKEDGFLTLGEIMNLRYNARVVVLSACETGLGWAERGEGITGLTRAVMYAGSPSAVVSLWNVDDEGTRDLMVRFYENMIRKGIGTAESLRQAKKEMLKTKYDNPFFWSAFVMYGE
ncbi:MAG: CHAT domain-containing tetratricopeptide repeat protein [Syntrophobacteraceae bacterium]